MSKYVLDAGHDRLRDARRALGQAKYLLVMDDRVEAERSVRSSLHLFRSAMNWLEGTEEFEVAHQELDAAGRFARETFGCTVERQGDQYFDSCPAKLAHNRIGMSIGYVVKSAECSICGLDPEDCPHIRGYEYDGVVCTRRLVELEVQEVSLVARPADPDARIERVSISHAELREALGDAFRPGIDVNCDVCLTPCAGVRRPMG